MGISSPTSRSAHDSCAVLSLLRSLAHLVAALAVACAMGWGVGRKGREGMAFTTYVGGRSVHAATESR